MVPVEAAETELVVSSDTVAAHCSVDLWPSIWTPSVLAMLFHSLHNYHLERTVENCTYNKVISSVWYRARMRERERDGQMDGQTDFQKRLHVLLC